MNMVSTNKFILDLKFEKKKNTISFRSQNESAQITMFNQISGCI